MFETLFSFFYLKAPRTVSSAISLGLSLDFFPVSFFSPLWGNGREQKKLIHNIRSVRVKESHPSSCSRTETILVSEGGLGLKVKSTKQKICVESRVVLIFVWSGFAVCCSNKVRTIRDYSDDGLYICFFFDLTVWRLQVLSLVLSLEVGVSCAVY